MQPDLLIVGDSHTAALQEAAIARGMNAKMLYISGNHWHENKMRPHATQGISAAYRPGLNRRIAAFAAEVGGSVFQPGIPVLASFGYHLGRLVPLFARHGHSPDGPQTEVEDQHLFVSDAFLHAYIAHHRGSLLRVLRLAAKQANVIVVAPPMIQTDPVALRFADAITEIVRGWGVTVFDPRREPDWSGKPLPDHLRAPDGVHGNAAYGQEVLARLFDRGLIRNAA